MFEEFNQQGSIIDENSSILKTGIEGLDALFMNKGIPRGNTVLIAGGPGTGKSILCRQICYNHISKSHPCMYVSFKEDKDRVIRSMKQFGWNIESYIEEDIFLIQKINPLDVLRMKFGSLGGSGSATELSYKIKPLIIPKDFNPEVIVVDSLTAIIAASITKEKNQRVYLQQLFTFFEETGATSFLIMETDPIPTRFSESGIEEFLADGIIVLYNMINGDKRRNAIEVLKMRYSAHEKKIVSLNITPRGVTVHPDEIVTLNLFP